MNRKHKAGDEMSFEAVTDLLRNSVFRSDPATDACPEETDYAGLIDGTLSDEERAHLADHLAHCQKCLDLVTCLVRVQDLPEDHVPNELLAAALRLGSDSQPSKRPVRFQWQASLAAAAGVILLVGVVATWYPQFTESESVRINGGGANHLAILFPENGATIDLSNSEFRWSSVDQSLYYEIQVLTESGDIRWEGRTEETQLQLPPELELDPNTGYFVWVRVYLPDGKTIKSKVVAIRIE